MFSNRIPKNLYNYLFVCLVFVGLSFFYRLVFYTYHADQFSDLTSWQIFIAMLWGLRFDIIVGCVAAFLNSLLSFAPYKNRLAEKIFISLFGAFQINFFSGNTMYFSESGRHIGYEMQTFGNDAFSVIATAFTQHTFLSTFSSLMIFAWFSLVWTKFRFSARKSGLLKSSLGFLVIVIVSVIGFRGGLQMIPIKPEFAYQIGDTKQAVLSLNPLYNAFYESSHSRALERYSIPMDHVEDELLVSFKKSYFSEAPKKPNIKKANVVMVLLEGWSSSLMGSYYGKFDTTPYFDSLRKKSLSSRYGFAAGHRTTEGMFASFCSFPNPLGKTVVQTQLQSFNYRCLPQILRELGWNTAFFQGSLKETSSVGSFAQILGFENSLARENITDFKDGKNYWGAQDKDIYRFALNYIDQNLKEPFFVAVNTNSTHDIVLPKNFEPPFDTESLEGKQKSIMRYSDEALKLFVESLEKKYPNSLFVLLADHTTHSEGSFFDHYSIPVLFYGKNVEAKERSVISQLDAAPSILSYLNVSEKEKGSMVGYDVFQQSDENYRTSFFHNGILYWVHGLKIQSLNIFNSNSESFLLSENLQTPPTLNKNPKNEKQMLSELSFFTELTQKLLFHGKTTEYKEILKSSASGSNTVAR